MCKVIAIVKQLGFPTWFMTLSCAHLRWPSTLLVRAFDAMCVHAKTNMPSKEQSFI